MFYFVTFTLFNTVCCTFQGTQCVFTNKMNASRAALLHGSNLQPNVLTGEDKKRLKCDFLS